MTTPADIKRWSSLLLPSKQGALKVRTREEIGQPYLYHISTDHGLRLMSPSVTRRTLGAEDRAIPRISVGTTLAGCILAYQSCNYDFESSDYEGWYVYGLPYQHAVRPNKTLLPDVEVSDEHWLVTFDMDTVNYYPRPIAKFFISDIATVRRLRNTLVRYSGFIDIFDPAGLAVAKGKVLKPGRYAFSWNKEDLTSYDKADKFEVTPVSTGEYISERKQTVSLLSFDDFRRPGSAYW